MTDDRFVRQAELVPRDQLAAIAVTVIGVGAIGRQLGWQLAALGVPRLQLIDFDTVERSNITTQGYRDQDCGRLKVQALAVALQELDPTLEVSTVPERFRPALAVVIVSWIGLFLYQNWARWLYLGLNVGLSLIFLPFAALDLSPQWGLATSIGTLGSLCTGAVLTLLFLTPVARRYQAVVNPR